MDAALWWFWAVVGLVSKGAFSFQVPHQRCGEVRLSASFESAPSWLSGSGAKSAPSTKKKSSPPTTQTSQPVWLKSSHEAPPAAERMPDASRTLKLLDSGPQWLSGDRRTKPKRHSSGAAKDASVAPVDAFGSNPTWIGAVGAPRLAMAYNGAAIIWLGAFADAAKASGYLSMASFLLAATAARLLASAAMMGRLSSGTYRRLNGCLAILGIGEAALFSQIKPASAVAHAVAASSAIVGCSAAGTNFLREAKDIFFISTLPSVKSLTANAYLAVLLMPALLAVISAPPAIALGAWTFLGVGAVLKDAAARFRLEATTFRRLNIVVGLSLFLVVHHISTYAPRLAPFLVTLASGSIILTLSNALRAIYVTKRI